MKSRGSQSNGGNNYHVKKEEKKTISRRCGKSNACHGYNYNGQDCTNKYHQHLKKTLDEFLKKKSDHVIGTVGKERRNVNPFEFYNNRGNRHGIISDRGVQKIAKQTGNGN